MGDIVKRGRKLSPQLQEKLYYNDHWGRDGGRDRETPKKYSWICVRCGGEFIFKEQAMRCCTKSNWAMTNALLEIETKGRMTRDFHSNDGYEYVDYIAGKIKKPKVIDFIMVVEKQIRLLEKDNDFLPDCQLKVENNKKLVFFKDFLPLIKDLKSYDEVKNVIVNHNYSLKEGFGINPDYQCEHCEFNCFITYSDHVDHAKDHVCEPCPHHDCAEYIRQERSKEWLRERGYTGGELNA